MQVTPRLLPLSDLGAAEYAASMVENYVLPLAALGFIGWLGVREIERYHPTYAGLAHFALVVVLVALLIILGLVAVTRGA